MKTKISIIIILIFLPWLIQAEFSIQTEYRYIRNINRQANLDLIADNLNHANRTADNYIDEENNYFIAHFFHELGNSYLILNKSEKALFYYLTQRVLFPNDSISSANHKIFLNTAYSCNLSDSLAKHFWEQTKKINLPTKDPDKLLLIIEMSIQLRSPELTAPIYRLGQKLKQSPINPPAWYKHWEFLTRMGYDEKGKMEILDFNSQNQSVFESVDDDSKNQIYRRAINYYINRDADRKARRLLDNYKKQQLSFWERVDFLIKSIRIKLP